MLSRNKKWLMVGAAAVAVLVIPVLRSLAEGAGQDPVLKHRQKLRAAAQRERGDVTAGRKLFFDRNVVACASCHSVVSGGDTRVAPSLAGVADRLDLDELISAVLDPSARVPDGYQRVVVTTTDGRVFNGLLKQKTDQGVELAVAGKRLTLTWEEIDNFRENHTSGMPEGLVDHLSPEQFADLIAYLRSLREVS
jgi:putative heme-binding domain-containing protein